MAKSDRDPLLINKVLGGILTAGIMLWAGVHIADGLMYDAAPEKSAIKIAGGFTQAAAVAVATGIPSINNLIPKADVSRGKTFASQQCSACHSFNKGGANGVGPNLYGVLNAPMFGSAGYSYSSAVKAKAKGNWTYSAMNDWLYNPQKYAPGTHMTYAGISNTNVRADVVAYLRSLSANPIPLPKPEPVVASAGAGAGGNNKATAASTSAGAGAPPIATLYAAASVSKGQGFFAQQCAACHSINKGGANGVGPNLYGVLQDKMFAKSGYSFSSAVKSKAHGKWTPHLMNQWLYDPQKYAPGTHMSYPGIKNNQMRANVIAYLNHASAHPAALPKAALANAAYKQTPQTNPKGNAPNDTLAHPGGQTSGKQASGKQAAGAEGDPSEGKVPAIAALYATGSAGSGKSFFTQQCAACHSAAKGGPNGVGPNLYGVVGAPKFAKAGYSFSSAAKKYAKGDWTPHTLNRWLYDPEKYAPGTHMAYPGIKDNQTRASVVEYLTSLSASPEKLPGEK